VTREKLNAVYSSLAMKRRYEVWFLRCGLADGASAWWFRYLLMNPGRGGCGADPSTMPAQVWATWFPRDERPQTFIQGFSLQQLSISGRGKTPLRCAIADNTVEDSACTGNLLVDGHAISWKLRYESQFGCTLSHKGWIGFSRTPHSGARFSGEILLDGKKFSGEPLGFGLQGHNCGYRHRTWWRWMHAYFPQPGGEASTLEALVYDLPFGLTFRKAILWYKGHATVFKRLEERSVLNEPARLAWDFVASATDGTKLQVTAAALGNGIHHLPYAKTDCSGAFPVANASAAGATARLSTGETLQTTGGAVLEMGG